MTRFDFKDTEIEGLKLVTPFCAEDERGYFSKVFEREIFAANGLELSLFEELVSFSHKGVLRGLHFQRHFSQDKLIQVMRGEVYDVAVDLRKGSPTFGKWKGFYLSSEERKMVYIPKGFAHGFLALEEGTLFRYFCCDRYDPETDGGVRWNDPQLAVDWPLDRVDGLIISDKDRVLPTLAEFVRQYGALELT